MKVAKYHRCSSNNLHKDKGLNNHTVQAFRNIHIHTQKKTNKCSYMLTIGITFYLNRYHSGISCCDSNEQYDILFILVHAQAGTRTITQNFNFQQTGIIKTMGL